MHNFQSVLKGFNKRATAVLTPEAMQAMTQPPMDPSMGGMPGGAPAPGGMPPGAPMDPAAMGGAPAPAMDPAAAGGAPMAQGSGGGQIPPEVLNDPMFMQFMQAMGVVFDPQSGTFMDPNGQPLSVDEVMQIYDMFQQQVAAQGGAPDGGAPADPAMGAAPMDPAAMGAPMGDPAAMGGMEAAPAGEVQPGMEGVDPSMALPPDVAAGAEGGDPAAMGGAGAGMAPMAGGAPAAMGGEDPVMEVASAVMTGVESVLEDFMTGLEKKLADMSDRIDSLGKAFDALQETTDKRSEGDKDAARSLEDDLAADLQPTLAAPVAEPIPLEMTPKTASAKPVNKPANLYSFICQKKG